jgi:hypothetical protein
MKMTPNEIRSKGYKALVDALGVPGMIRFLQQFDTGHGDYTKERHQWLDKVTLEEILVDVEQLREEESSTQEEGSK